MKIKNLVSVLLLISIFICSQGFAYNVYNSLGYTVNILDEKNRGLNRSIENGGYVSCNPTSTGCSGNMKLKVYLLHPSDVLCRWNGTLGTESGNYFVITKTNDAPCKITHYHD